MRQPALEQQRRRACDLNRNDLSKQVLCKKPFWRVKNSDQVAFGPARHLSGLGCRGGRRLPKPAQLAPMLPLALLGWPPQTSLGNLLDKGILSPADALGVDLGADVRLRRQQLVVSSPLQWFV